jgi:hypothetical protein
MASTFSLGHEHVSFIRAAAGGSPARGFSKVLVYRLHFTFAARVGTRVQSIERLGAGIG